MHLPIFIRLTHALHHMKWKEKAFHKRYHQTLIHMHIWKSMKEKCYHMLWFKPHFPEHKLKGYHIKDIHFKAIVVYFIWEIMKCFVKRHLTLPYDIYKIDLRKISELSFLNSITMCCLDNEIITCMIRWYELQMSLGKEIATLSHMLILRRQNATGYCTYYFTNLCSVWQKYQSSSCEQLSLRAWESRFEPYFLFF